MVELVLFLSVKFTPRKSPWMALEAAPLARDGSAMQVNSKTPVRAVAHHCFRKVTVGGSPWLYIHHVG